MVTLFLAVHPVARVASGFGYSQLEARTALRFGSESREVPDSFERTKSRLLIISNDLAVQVVENGNKF
jgi:hypothetical protein